MKNKLLLLLACCAMVASCSKDGGGNGSGKKYAGIKQLDVADAKCLYSISGGVIARSAESSADGAKLFKILANTQTKEVAVVDENGEQIPVTDIYCEPLNEKLLFFGFGYRIEDKYDDNYSYTEYHAYLIHSENGTALEIPNALYPAFDWPPIDYYKQEIHPSKYILSDKNNNLYCIVQSTIYKVTVGSSITLNALTTDAKTASDIYVDWLETILYQNSSGGVTCITPPRRTEICNRYYHWRYRRDCFFPKE